MKKIEITEEFYNAAAKLAEYILDSQNEYEEYNELLKQGIDEKSCIYYQAIVVCEEKKTY